MKVETYEIEEVNSECAQLAADSEAVELIKKLGLKGQQQLVESNSDTRLPYPMMDDIQLAVFRILYPTETTLEEFNRGIIPLRVLQVAAFCKDLPMLKRIVVWHSEVPKEDPLLVGCDREHQYYSDQHFFMLARWGDALKPFDELKELAKKKWAEVAHAKLLTIKSQVESMLANLPVVADARFAEGKNQYPEFNSGE